MNRPLSDLWCSVRGALAAPFRVAQTTPVPDKRDILFCALLACAAFAIFLVARSWSVPLLSDSVAFDGKYYLDIATHGYSFSGVIQDRQNISFLPLESFFIALSRWLLPGHNDFLKIALLGVLVLFGTLLGLFCLLGNHEGRQAAQLSATLWTFSPLAFYHFVGYTEPVFALATVWCLVALRRRWMWTASLIAGVSMLGRPQAFVLVLFVGFELLRGAGWRPWRLVNARDMLKLALLVVPLMAFASWMALAFHDSAVYVNSAAAWRKYYDSIGYYLPFFRAVGFFMHSVSVEAPALTDWKVMLGTASLVIAMVSIVLSPAAPRREALMYFAFLAFLAMILSFDVSNFGRHILYLAPWTIIWGTALARLPGPAWRKWAALVPLFAFCVLVDVYAVMRFYQWEWVS